MYDYLQPIETMQRISREELAEKLDELLDIVAKDNVGFVITDQGKDDLVLCPVRLDTHWDGRHICQVPR